MEFKFIVQEEEKDVLLVKNKRHIPKLKNDREKNST